MDVLRSARAAGKRLAEVTHGERCTACEGMSLGEKLEALERADPAVAAAAAKYEVAVASILGRSPAETDYERAVRVLGQMGADNRESFKPLPHDPKCGCGRCKPAQRSPGKARP
jgi:hypothetical protein